MVDPLEISETAFPEAEALVDAYAVFPAERFARVYGPAEIAELAEAWAALPAEVRAGFGEKIAGCSDDVLVAVGKEISAP